MTDLDTVTVPPACPTSGQGCDIADELAEEDLALVVGGGGNGMAGGNPVED
jgi:hypothetical protein